MVDSHGNPSNLKCVAYSDIHTAVEKTNFGGQQLLPPPAGTTHMSKSSGWAVEALPDPETPEGYQFVFGPASGANNSPGVRSVSIIRCSALKARWDSIWVQPLSPTTMSLRALICATLAARMRTEVLASTLTSGVLL